jgi:Periplasmic binding protein-like domain
MISAMGDEFGFSASRERLAGYRQALAAAEVEAREDMLVAATYGIDGGAEAMEQLLSGDVLPTSVFAEYDELAIGAMRTLSRAGISVPGQVSVVGFDDHEMAAVVDLTTVAQPVYEQGTVAAGLLLDALSGQLAGPESVVMPTRLLIRGSTGPPAPRRRAGEAVTVPVDRCRSLCSRPGPPVRSAARCSRYEGTCRAPAEPSTDRRSPRTSLLDCAQRPAQRRPAPCRRTPPAHRSRRRSGR